MEPIETIVAGAGGRSGPLSLAAAVPTAGVGGHLGDGSQSESAAPDGGDGQGREAP